MKVRLPDRKTPFAFALGFYIRIILKKVYRGLKNFIRAIRGKQPVPEKRPAIEKWLQDKIIRRARGHCECYHHPKHSIFPPCQFHHLDGNKSNNNERNIIYVCPNCHIILDRRAKRRW